MAYTHLTMKDLGWIETYNDIGYKAYEIAKKLGRSNQLSITLSTSLSKAVRFMNTLTTTSRINRNVVQRKKLYERTDAIH